MANINISIPDDIHKDLKIAAVMQQQSLKTLIIETLEHYASTENSISSSVSSTKKTNKKSGVRK